MASSMRCMGLSPHSSASNDLQRSKRCLPRQHTQMSPPRHQTLSTKKSWITKARTPQSATHPAVAPQPALPAPSQFQCCCCAFLFCLPAGGAHQQRSSKGFWHQPPIFSAASPGPEKKIQLHGPASVPGSLAQTQGHGVFCFFWTRGCC